MTMDFSSIPSLKHRAFVKIAVIIIDHHDIHKLTSESYRTLSSRFYNPGEEVDLQSSIEFVKNELVTITNDVLKYVLNLPVPSLIKNDILYFVKATVWQLFKWGEYFLEFDRKNPSTFAWTPQGTLDKDKSLELHMKDIISPSFSLFILASRQCLEDYISMSWKHIREIENLEEIRVHWSDLISFWAHYAKGKLHLLSEVIEKYCIFSNISPCFSLYECMFHYCVTQNHSAATRYFFQKLTLQQKEKLLLPSVLYSVEYYDYKLCLSWDMFSVCVGECYAQTSAFLISNLNEEQEEMLRRYPYHMLKSFLIWPRQTFFMELAKSMFCSPDRVSPSSAPEIPYYTTMYFNWDFSPKVQYFRVLKMIAFKILSDSTDYNYRKLFDEFWHESHYTYKNYVMTKYTSDSVLSSVFKVGNTENTQLVVKDEFFSREGKPFC